MWADGKSQPGFNFYSFNDELTVAFNAPELAATLACSAFLHANHVRSGVLTTFLPVLPVKWRDIQADLSPPQLLYRSLLFTVAFSVLERFPPR